jgi:hypothetical protein
MASNDNEWEVVNEWEDVAATDTAFAPGDPNAPPESREPDYKTTGWEPIQLIGRGAVSLAKKAAPFAAGMGAAIGTGAITANPFAGGAAFGVGYEAMDKLLRDPKTEDPSWQQSARNVLASTLMGPLGKYGGEKLLAALPKMSGSALSQLLRLGVYGAGEGLGTAAGGMAADVAMIPFGGEGPSLNRSLLEGAIGGTAGALGKVIQVTARPSANQGQLANIGAQDFPAAVAKQGEPAFGAISRVFPGAYKDEITNKATGAIQKSMLQEFPGVTLSSTAPAGPGAVTAPSLLKNVKSAAGNVAELELAPLMAPAAPVGTSVAPMATVARGEARKLSEGLVDDLFGMVDPNLSTAAKVKVGDTLINKADAARQAVGGQYDTMVKTLGNFTKGQPIPATNMGKEALSLYDSMLSAGVPSDSPLARLAKNLADEATDPNRAFSADDLFQKIQNMRALVRKTTQPVKEKALEGLTAALEQDVMGAIKTSSAYKANPKAVESAIATFDAIREKYRNARWLQNSIEESTVAGRFDPEKALTVFEQNTPEMSPALQDSIIQRVQGYADDAVAKAPKVLRGTTGDLFDKAAKGDAAALRTIENNPQLAGEMIERIKTDAAKNIPTGGGMDMKLSLGENISAWYNDHPQLAAILERIDNKGMRNLERFARASQPSSTATQMRKIGSAAATNDPRVIGDILTDPSITPEAINELKISGGTTPLGMPAEAQALGSLAVSTKAAPGGTYDPALLQDLLKNLPKKLDEAGIDSPTREKLVAMLTSGQIKRADEILPLLDKWAQYTGTARKLPAQQPLGQAYRDVAYPTATGAAQGANATGGSMAGKLGGAALAFLSAILGPRALEKISSVNWSPEAIRRLETAIMQLKYRGGERGGEKK